ncbi:hypothetical protein [Breznakiella homolactica]|uniref:Uncharacterized protein n=1 Tax=Breznakiella homolactica TaxID=2798577 RepID=A0A7T7XNQ6_9SPIR|nr:hypothetical protein [Breznakiella homolactica]QQO09701.1 hypothetical protein JFL75_01930 [Breznakiella homolactica]
MAANQLKQHTDDLRIEKLREMVDNEEYLHNAIHRIAQVLSNEILSTTEGGAYNERQWTGRK